MRSPALRFLILVTVLSVGLALSYQLGLVEWLRGGSLADRVLALRGEWWTPVALLGLFVLTGCLPLPATAVVLVGGAVYGPLRGWAFNLFGCLVGAGAGYGLARALGRDFVARVLGPKRWAKLDGLMQQHGFWAMVRARWMLPLAVVNHGGGVGGMKGLPFLLSSALGMAVPVALYTYVGHVLIVAPTKDPARAIGQAAAVVLGMLALSLAGPAFKWWRKRSTAAQAD